MIRNRTDGSLGDSADDFQPLQGPMIQPILVTRHQQLTIAPVAAINPIPGTATTGFKAHAGEVMASPRVFAIYWGRNYGSPMTGMNATASNLDTFFTTILANDTYMSPLNQYNVGAATFLGSTWVDHDPATAQTLNYNDMRDILITWLHAGLSPVVPASNELDLLFVIFTPTEVTLTDLDGKSDFCAYHWFGYYNKGSGKYNLFFAVVDATASTASVSHELVEAFTDRNGNGWHSDDDGSEIGDVCSSCGSATVTIGGFAAASYWLVNQGRCLQQSDVADLDKFTAPPVLSWVVNSTPNEAWVFLSHPIPVDVDVKLSSDDPTTISVPEKVTLSYSAPVALVVHAPQSAAFTTKVVNLTASYADKQIKVAIEVVRPEDLPVAPLEIVPSIDEVLCARHHIEGSSEEFVVKNSDIIWDHTGLIYNWTVTGTTAPVTNAPVLNIPSLPSAGTRVTIKVQLTNAFGIHAVGTYEFTTVQQEAGLNEQIRQLDCLFRQLKAINLWIPPWVPIEAGEIVLDDEQLVIIENQSKRVVVAAEQLVAVAKAIQSSKAIQIRRRAKLPGHDT